MTQFFKLEKLWKGIKKVKNRHSNNNNSNPEICVGVLWVRHAEQNILCF